MIKPEEDGEKDGEGECGKDLADAEIPKIDEPAPIIGRLEGDACRESLQMYPFHPSDMHEACEEDNRERGAIVFQEDPYPMQEKAARAHHAAEVGRYENQQGDDNGKIE